MRKPQAYQAPSPAFATLPVKEQLIFTDEDSPMANLMLSVMSAFAEFERALIRERQLEGIALAKRLGVDHGATFTIGYRDRRRAEACRKQ
ncbi:MAG TPA: recombinase family protein [Bryobacteraceae bacterium]|nr:recombinase family protein [Bryobacteraceae bacterium]